MNYRFIATKIGEDLKYDTSIGIINRTFKSLVNYNLTSHDNPGITSVRAKCIYDWIMTIGENGVAEDELKNIIKQAVFSLTDNDSIKSKIYELLDIANTNIVEKTSNYVHESRIKELNNINTDKYDMTKLIQLCKEINIANSNQCYISVAMILRAIIDHVPPLFLCKTFSEVYNNYVGSKSFKQSMAHLDNSCRKIADSYLHQHIRNKEILPNMVQVNYSSDLDVLLAEICRIYKNNRRA